jgi:hypothetical protein
MDSTAAVKARYSLEGKTALVTGGHASSAASKTLLASWPA